MQNLKFLLLLIMFPGLLAAQKIELTKQKTIRISNGTASYEFRPDFKLIYSAKDPKMLLKNLSEVNYFAPTWEATAIPAEKMYSDRKKDVSRGGDGIDESLDAKLTNGRTGDIFYSGQAIDFKLISVEKIKDTIYIKSIAEDFGSIIAKVYSSSTSLPFLSYTFHTKKTGYFSIVYCGSPEFKLDELQEVWQPMIWQQKRFPEFSYLSLAYQCPIPATFAGHKSNTVGVLVDSKEMPFQPLPTRDNNRFGVALRNKAGNVQPMVVAPVLGHLNSGMKTGDQFSFSLHLVALPTTISKSYENIARSVFNFHDYRHNDFVTVNQTLDNEIDYGLSPYSCFIDSLKGCSYSTDVPGSTKNVSSLNPLSIALVTDNENVYRKRAYPIMEYMLSRDNTLFCLDTLQKVQSPSRKLGKPCAPLSELVSLYNMSGKTGSFFLRWAEDKFYKNTPIEKRENGRGLWSDCIEMYRSTGDTAYLNWAIRGAKFYIKSQVNEPQTKLRAEFFWSSYAPKYIPLLELYEITKDKEFLEAAHKAARLYAMFVWMTPEIPTEKITVNENNKAPWYWYLKSRGLPQQSVPEESVYAWRLSETGLVSESSTTGIGHRAVFMAHHAPYFLRLFHYTGDEFLRDIARSAIVGRYSNFPGYHINTERTTAYEKFDFPLRNPDQISATSFHYNHPFPHMSILLDYLVTDAMDKSNDRISFPSLHIEGYGYLQNKFYGHASGRFFDDKNVWLWMPQRLLTTSNTELNYISARGDKAIYMAFMNQSSENVTSEISFNLSILPQFKDKTIAAELWVNNKNSGKVSIINGKLQVKCSLKGIVSIIVRNIEVESSFQQKFADKDIPWKHDYYESNFGRSSALLINMSKEMKTAYVYLRDDDYKFSKVNMLYKVDNGKFKSMEDGSYPYEFTADIPQNAENVFIQLTGIDKSGNVQKSELFKLSKN